MIEFVPDPEQRIFASPEHEARLRYVESRANRVSGSLIESISSLAIVRAQAIERAREEVISEYTGAGFEKMEAWAQRCDTAVLGTDFADTVEYELSEITPFLLEGDESHGAVQEHYREALNEDEFRKRDDDWPGFPLERTLEYIDRRAKSPKPGSRLDPSRYRDEKDRWDNWYADGIDIKAKYLGSEEDGETE